jgi:UDP-N-acetylmuramoylalanine--D-glutamate ligase
VQVTGGNVLVVGLGRSGRASVDFLLGLRAEGAPVTLAARDEADTEPLREIARAYTERGVDVRLGTADGSGPWDLVVVSPGVPPGSELYASAAQSGAPVVSEIELAFGHSSAPFVAVTGTNGKTTTAALTAHLLRTSGIASEAIGNIDPPALAVAPGASADAVMVCETSSFQLANIRDFHPVVSILLNITPDHMDWHGSMERYVADKARVFENQCGSDLAIVVVDDVGAAPFAERAAARGVRVCRVSVGELHPGGAGVVDGMLTVSTATGPVPLVAPSELLIRGEHNVLNALAASAAALEMGADPALIAMGLRSFAPIPHRLQPVGVVGDVEYVNDSKATNPEAVGKALGAFADRAIVLLLGGRNKGNTFSELASLLPERVRAAVLFGEAAGAIARDVGDTVPVKQAGALAEAVRIASELAEPGDVVLLSPGCASFDEFADYEARGDAFARIVDSMAQVSADG